MEELRQEDDGWGDTVGKEGSWTEYFESTVSREPFEWFESAIAATNGDDGAGRLVIDLGSGAGVESIEFLSRGWNVFATDREPEAIDILVSNVGPEYRDRLETVVGAFHEIDLPQAHLVFAQLSLPFSPAEHFQESIQRALGAVRPGGWFVGQLFGPNDQWAGRGVKPVDRDGITKFFSGFDPLSIDEQEFDGLAGAKRRPKHWHWFHIQARRTDG